MLFSLIVPVYNTSRYLAKCIESIASQLTGDSELILVDDGSTDQSGQICDAYAKANPFIHVIHQENAGVSAARNRGIDASEGDYLWFIDSDDQIARNALFDLKQVIIAHDADLVFFDWQCFTDGHFYEQSHFQMPHRCLLTDKKRYIYQKLIKDSCYNSVCRLLLKRRMVSGLYFQSDIHSAPDFVYAMEVYGRIQNFCYLNRPLYCYYINSGSYTRVFELKKYSEFKRVRKLLWDHMYEWGCDSEFDKRHYATRWICNAMTLIKVALLESDWSMRHDCIQKIRSIVFDDEFQLQLHRCDMRCLPHFEQLFARAILNPVCLNGFLYLSLFACRCQKKWRSIQSCF